MPSFRGGIPVAGHTYGEWHWYPLGGSRGLGLVTVMTGHSIPQGGFCQNR
jgi:hypothetical protein